MKKIFFTICYIVIIVYLQSCSLVGPGRPTITNSLFRIKVDSVGLPSNSVFSNDTLKISFWGAIGNDSCYTFAHFQGSKDIHQIDLVLWGQNSRTSNDVCPSGQINLNGKIFYDYPVTVGDYLIVIHQPDGTLLQRSAHIYP